MTRLVVDSSVVIKWWVPEVHSADALRYLDPDLERDAPELLLAEISNILWKKVGRNELTREQAERIAADVGQADVTIHPMGLAVADALFTRVVTADRRLHNAGQNGAFERLVLGVEDRP
jgi:predicted nucleic acid-binding protein